MIEAAAELAGLIRTCPNLKLLVTSREVLRVSGEIEYPVPPLARDEAVLLFCERSALAPAPEISTLCERLDSMPLAVELAAARTRALSPAQILDRLSQRLDLLKGGRDADPRQQTLRATIEWSYELLYAEEQKLFVRLSVFAGGWTLAAAEDVCDADLDTLQSLVEKSLVRFAGERYWMFETIKEFVSEQLAARGESETMCERHAEFFTSAAEATHGDWMYGHEVRSPYRWFRTEQANLRDAVGWAGDHVELQLRLLHAARQYGTFSGHERRRLLESALARANDQPPVVRARALVGAGEASMDVDDYESALRYHEQALAIYRSIGDGEGMARSLVGRGWDLRALGRPADGRASFEEALHMARRAQSAPVISGASTSLALASLEDGAFEDALRLAADADTIGGASSMLAARIPGLVALERGDLDGAVGLLSETLATQHEFGYEPSIPFTLDALASALTALGHVERAVVLIGYSGALRDSLGFRRDPYVSRLHERVVETGRSELGGGFQAAIDRGASMSLDEAIELALGDA